MTSAPVARNTEGYTRGIPPGGSRPQTVGDATRFDPGDPDCSISSPPRGGRWPAGPDEGDLQDARTHRHRAARIRLDTGPPLTTALGRPPLIRPSATFSHEGRRGRQARYRLAFGRRRSGKPGGYTPRITRAHRRGPRAGIERGTAPRSGRLRAGERDCAAGLYAGYNPIAESASRRRPSALIAPGRPPPRRPGWGEYVLRVSDSRPPPSDGSESAPAEERFHRCRESGPEQGDRPETVRIGIGVQDSRGGYTRGITPGSHPGFSIKGRSGS